VIPIFRAEFTAAEFDAVRDVLASGQLSRGEVVAEFERSFARYLGVPHVVAVSSGTAALDLALASAEIAPASEVIVPSLTFVATAFAAEHAQLTPVFADIDERTLNLSIDDVRSRITPRTRAIIPIHYAGRPCEMTELHALAHEHGLLVIEDAAHAVGATYGGHKIGSHSPLTTFSFFATKTMSSGEGGAISCLDQARAAELRLLRGHGIRRAVDAESVPGDYDVVRLGHNYHLGHLNIALLKCQLATLETRIARRKQLAKLYERVLREIDEVQVPSVLPGEDHVFHLYTVVLGTKLAGKRDRIIREMRTRGVQTGIYYPPVHQFSYFRRKYPQPLNLPVTEAVAPRLLTLPFFDSLSEAEVECVSRALRDSIVSVMTS
jgi:perosamine synthetase